MSGPAMLACGAGLCWNPYGLKNRVVLPHIQLYLYVYTFMNTSYSKMAVNNFIFMLINPLCLVNMYNTQRNFEVKMRQRALINMQTKILFIGRLFGIRCMIMSGQLVHYWVILYKIASVDSQSFLL